MAAEERVADQQISEPHLTEEQAYKIRHEKFRFIWRITYTDGEVIEQLNPAGEEQKINFWKPASRVEWISVYAGQRSASLPIPPGAQFQLWRNVISSMSNVTFIGAYILGYDMVGSSGMVDQKIRYFISPMRRILVRPESIEPTAPSWKPEQIVFEQALEGPEDNDSFKYAMFRWWERNFHRVLAME